MDQIVNRGTYDTPRNQVFYIRLGCTERICFDSTHILIDENFLFAPPASFNSSAEIHNLDKSLTEYTNGSTFAAIYGNRIDLPSLGFN